MLTTTSQFTPRARSLHIQHVVAIRALAATGMRQRQQTRGFRFGDWSSYLDDDFQRQVRRRHRKLKHKYVDSINRRLSWDKHPFADMMDHHHALKRMMKSYWHSPDGRPGGRSCDNAEPEPNKQRTPANDEGARPGRNIEDVERGAMDHLIFGEDEQNTPSRHPTAKRQRKAARAARQKHSLDHPSYDQPAEQDDFIIDPITNRKVAKNPTPSSAQYGDYIAVKTFKDYRSQFVYPDGMTSQAKSESYLDEEAPSVEALRKYVQARNDPDQNSDASGSDRADPLPQSDENLLSREPARSRYSYFDDPRLWDDGPLAPAPKNEQVLFHSPGVDRKTYYVGEDSPNGHECDLHNYRPVEHLGPDGEPDPTTAEHFEHSEQDTGIHQLRSALDDAHDQFDDLKPPYEDLDQYENKTLVSDEIAKRFDDVEPNDAEQYQPTPDELASVKEVPGSDYHNLDQYNAVKHDEPDGKPLGFKEESVKPEVLRNYRSFIERLEPGDFPESTVEDLRKKYSQAELKQYTAVRYQESDGTPPPSAEYSSEYHPDLNGRDKSATFEEPDRQLPAYGEHGEGLAQEKMHTEAGQYWGPFLRDEANGPPSPFEERISKRLNYLRDELDSDQQPIMLDQPSGKPAPAKDQATSAQDEKSNYREMLDSLMKLDGHLSDAIDREASLAVKSAKTRNQQSSPVGDSPVRKLTGNYVRDFPEEFEKSWTEVLSSAQAETAETNYSNEFQTEGSMDGGLEGAFGHPEPFRIQPALDRHVEEKPVVDNQAQDLEGPKGQETSFAEHHETFPGNPSNARPSTPAEENKFTAAEEPNVAPAKVSEPSGTEVPNVTSKKVAAGLDDGPTLYKILAYDPTMQNVNIAETTSLIPDFTSALSPTDALLRLSQPLKFFPYFERLGQEGFEIVSGSGDVLIFRKARPSTLKEESPGETQTQTQTESRAAAAEPEPEHTERPVNPIDMTGRPRLMSPASANFASPTGYVTYDNLPENEASNLPPPPPPRVKYNIDLRREEPVFSGPKYRADSGQKQRQSLGKRLLVGGVWVAGISYGLGVVSEYFTTGGVDGLGPTGF